MPEESPVCPLCASPAFTLVRDKCRDLLYRCAGEWSLVECETCGLVYTSPSLEPEALLNYYPSNYVPYHPISSLRSNILGSVFRSIAMSPYRLRFGSPDWNERPFDQGRLLDVGCGAGMFLKKASSLGWQCWGIDVSPIAVRAAQVNVPGATVSSATLDELTANTQYNFINLSHVLEHLPSPRSALQKSHDLLSPGGKLCLNLPNIDSLEAKIFGARWVGLDIPRHLVHFRPAVIERLLEAIGFVSITIRPAMFASSISTSLLMTLPERIRYRLLGSRLDRLFYLSMIFPASLSYLFGNAGTIEITARKL
jgi:2-polyprenyl-3-methyl-5-hydroxy-6-metoxy-1,4-benzoquinol methylase